MATYSFPKKLQKLIAKEMAAGSYDDEQDLLVQAVQSLAERRAAIEGIRRGLADMKAGRMRSWKVCRRELLKRHPHLTGE